MKYRHLDPYFIPAAIAGELPPLDGFDWQLGHIGYEDVARVCEHYGARADRYVNVITHPCPEWVGGDPIVNYVARVMPILTAPAPPPDPTSPGQPEGKKAFFPLGWFGCVDQHPRYIIDWRTTDTGKLMGFAQTIKSETDRVIGAHSDPTLAKVGVRLDVFWPQPEWWMFDSTGAAFADFPAKDWQYWTRRKLRFRTMLQSVLGHSVPIVVNGEWTNQHPMQLENAHWWGRWDSAVALWHQHQDAILTTNASYPEWTDRLIELHDRFPHKWVSFTGDDPDDVNEAYERLAA